MRNILSFHRERPYEWKPGENTIAYFPLTSTTTVNDMSGNGHTLTNVGSTSFDSISAIFSGSNYLYCSPLGETNPFTVSFWLYIDSSSWDSTEKGLVRHTWGTYNGWHSTIINHSSMPHTKDIRVGTEPSNNSTYTSSTPSDGWHNVVIVCSTSNMSFYLDTILQGTNTAPAQTGNNGYFTIGTEYRTGFGNNYKGKISEVIVESGLRDETARAKYYNRSKDNYESTPHIPVYDNLLETKDASNWITSSVNYDRYLGAQFDYVSPITTSYKIVIERVGGSLVAVSPTSQSDSSQYSTSDEGIVSVESGNHPVIYTYFPPRSTGGYIAYLYGDSAA